MKRTRAPMFPILVFATAFVLGIVPRAHANDHKECSNATLQSSFGYTATGTLLPASAPPPFSGPFGEVGRQTFDGRGDTEATATLSANGNIIKITAVGTYTVNPDCTGSMTVTVSPLDITGTTYFVIDDDRLEIRTIDTDPGVVETRVYRKQFQRDNQQ